MPIIDTQAPTVTIENQSEIDSKIYSAHGNHTGTDVIVCFDDESLTENDVSFSFGTDMLGACEPYEGPVENSFCRRCPDFSIEHYYSEQLQSNVDVTEITAVTFSASVTDAAGNFNQATQTIRIISNHLRLLSHQNFGEPSGKRPKAILP